MSKKTYLKSKNIPIIILFIIWCISIYITFLAGFDDFWNELQMKFMEFKSKEGFIVAFMPVLLIIFSGLVSSELKAKLVFWRIKNALPGHRAFSSLAPCDARIDMKRLKAKMKTIPKDPKEQNTSWHRLYKKYEEAPTVKNSHRNFLLARDLSTISLIFAFFGTVGLIFGRVNLKVLLMYFFAMVAHYIAFAVTAQNHGKRFVCNVISEYLADD